MLEKTLESPQDCKEIKSVHPKGNQPWICFGMTDAEAETPIFWPPDAKSWLIRKNPDAGKDGRQEENGVTEDEMVGWYHWLNGHEFEQASGVGDGQWSLPCSSPWGPTKSRTQPGNWIRSVITRHSKLLSVISWRSLLLFSLWSIWTPSWSNELSKTEGVNPLLSYSFSFFPPILPSCFLQNNNRSTLPTSVSSLPVSCFCKTRKKIVRILQHYCED